MSRSLRWRTLALVGIFLVCIGIVLPTLMGRSLPSWFPFQRPITLGLDLEGGSHIVYSIDLDEAVADRAVTIKRDLDASFADARLGAVVKTPQPAGSLTVIPREAARRPEIEARITADHGDTLESRPCLPTDGAGAICRRVSTRYAEGIKRAALSNAVSTIRDRIDELGVAEPSVVEKGDEIIVELPGLDKDLIATTRSVIARTAKLEFRVVEDGSDYMRRLYAHVGSAGRAGTPTDPRALRDGIVAEIDQWQAESGNPRRTDYYLLAHDRREVVPLAEARRLGCVARGKPGEPAGDGKVWCELTGRVVIQRYVEDLAATDPSFAIPDDRQLGFELVEPQPNAKDQRPRWRSYYLERAVQLTGTSIEDVSASYDPNTRRPIVLLDFNRLGGRVFGELTTRIAGAKLATILDGRVRSAPVITEPIRGGRASITLGGGDAQREERERDELVNVLKTGSLPAPLQEESASQIGPTLGQDAIERARLAFALGVAIVIVILVWIYRTSGAIALVTLTLNILFVLALLVAFDATLTLPGIAGIVLTFGMSVDGNIIIFERIREELDRNKTIRRAVDIGYSRAFSAILDGQLTTMSGGIVLLIYGTGPITGFAVTLIMGNVTALFANIWCTRVLYDHYVDYLRARDKPLAI